MSAFRYISSKLAHRNIHLDFILDDSHNNDNDNGNQGCILIPLRPLSRSEQTTFIKITSSARLKFPGFRVQTRSLDRGALASSSSSSAFSLDARAAGGGGDMQNPNLTAATRTMKHEHIFEVVNPIHLLHQSDIPHHIVFHADGLLVLSIDSSANSEEVEEFILHSSSSWSSLEAGEIGGGDSFDSPIYRSGLRDYFRNSPRLGRADIPTITAHQSDNEGRDNYTNTAGPRPTPRSKVRDASSVFFFNNNNKAYPSALRQPSVTAPHHHHHNHSRDTITSNSSSNKKLIELPLSKYPSYSRDSGQSAYAASARVEYTPSSRGMMKRDTGIEYINSLSSLGEGQETEDEGDWGSTTMILGSEWEAFRRIGLGVGG